MFCIHFVREYLLYLLNTLLNGEIYLFYLNTSLVETYKNVSFSRKKVLNKLMYVYIILVFLCLYIKYTHDMYIWNLDSHKLR